MEYDEQGIMPGAVFAGALGEQQAAVAPGQGELRQALDSDQGHHERQPAYHRNNTCSALKPGPRASMTP